MSGASSQKLGQIDGQNWEYPIYDADENIPANTNTIKAIIPLTGTVTLTLPTLSRSRFQRYYVTCERASGAYVDGKVVVQSPEGGYTSSDFVNTGHRLCVENLGGEEWNEVVTSV